MLATITLEQRVLKVYHWTKITKEEIEQLPKNAEWSVYFTLKMFMGSNGVAYPAASTIAQITGCSVPSVRRAIRGLLKKGLLVRDGFDPKKNTARLCLANCAPCSNLNRESTPNLNMGSPPNLNMGSTPNLNTNNQLKTKTNNNKQLNPNPIYLLPRLD